MVFFCKIHKKTKKLSEHLQLKDTYNNTYKGIIIRK
jgi:hypothetical protein